MSSPGTDGTDAADPRNSPYDAALLAQRASSFGAEAAAYAAHRPDYPEAALRWALRPAAAGTRGGADTPAGPGAPATSGTPVAPTALDVLDLGAGTGKLSAGVVALGHRVTAVEPDPEMLAELRRQVPQVTAASGGAEHIPLPDGSVDAVLVGQAFHWFDQQQALPEIARVLRPGGVLGALWNFDDDRVEWIAGLSRVSRTPASFAQWRSGDGIDAHPAYSPVEQADFGHRRPHTADSLTATLATHSHILILDPADRAAALARVRDYLRSRPETAGGAFALDIVTRVQRCVLRPPLTGR